MPDDFTHQEGSVEVGNTFSNLGPPVVCYPSDSDFFKLSEIVQP